MKMRVKRYPHRLATQLGIKHVVEGVVCVVRYVNAGKGWLYPLIDDPDDKMVLKCCALGIVDANGRVRVI